MWMFRLAVSLKVKIDMGNLIACSLSVQNNATIKGRIAR